MKEKPLLTAIIFTYNHALTISRCIESHINQKTTYPYEIQIWDDCSADDTTNICKEYAAKYPNKIKLITQNKNTFLLPYNETQSYQAVQQINTKYFCIIDGDDCWCDENKIQIALDILENNPEYVGFAHDTLEVNTFLNKEASYVHDLRNWEIKNPVKLGATPFFYTSSRIFRNIGFAEKHIWPVDYLLYFYHFSNGDIFYYDKIMANYYISPYNTFSNLESNEAGVLLSTFAYKIAKIFNFEQDELATDVQKYYNSFHPNVTWHYNVLIKFKKFFGIKAGWNLWFFFIFVPRFGLECMNLNWVCPRKKVKFKANNRTAVERKRINKIRKNLNKKIRLAFIIKKILSMNLFSKTRLNTYLEESLKHKYKKIKIFKKEIYSIKKNIILLESSFSNKGDIK